MEKNRIMTCNEAQHKIKDYMEGTLSLEEAADFVAHVRGCQACRDELEAFYIFYEAISQKEETEDDHGNFSLAIERKLIRTEAMVARAKKEYRIKKATYYLVALLVAAAVGVSFRG